VTQDRPSPAELCEAVREFLEAEILPTLGDHRLKFRTLVAINGLGIAERELRSDIAPGLAREELTALAERIRGGDVPEGTLAVLKAHVRAKLEVSNPRYLARYENGAGDTGPVP
jgi:Domain of unknown function (DUF6285)